MSNVKATRNGVNREFPIEVWNKMPADKYGWTKQAELPAEVKELRGQSEKMDSNPGEGIKVNGQEGDSLLPPIATKEKANAPKNEKAPAKEKVVKEKTTKATKEKANAQG